MKRYKLANKDLLLRYTKQSKIQINNMTESKIILKNFNKNNKKYYEAALVLFVLMVGILYFSIYFSFKNIIFKYGFDVRIIFKDFFEQPTNFRRARNINGLKLSPWGLFASKK